MCELKSGHVESCTPCPAAVPHAWVKYFLLYILNSTWSSSMADLFTRNSVPLMDVQCNWDDVIR